MVVFCATLIPCSYKCLYCSDGDNNILRLPVAVRLRRRRSDSGSDDCNRVLTWASTTSRRARSTSSTADGGWSPVAERASWSASSSTVTDRAAARFDLAVAYKQPTYCTLSRTVCSPVSSTLPIHTAFSYTPVSASVTLCKNG